MAATFKEKPNSVSPELPSGEYFYCWVFECSAANLIIIN